MPEIFNVGPSIGLNTVSYAGPSFDHIGPSMSPNSGQEIGPSTNPDIEPVDTDEE